MKALRSGSSVRIAISAATPRQQQSVAALAGGDADTPLRDRAATWIASTSGGVALAALIEARVPATAVHDLAAVADDPQVQHRESLRTLDGWTIVRPKSSRRLGPTAAGSSG